VRKRKRKSQNSIHTSVSFPPQCLNYFPTEAFFALARFLSMGGIGLGWTGLDRIGRYLSLPANYLFLSAFSLNAEAGIKGIAGDGMNEKKLKGCELFHFYFLITGSFPFFHFLFFSPFLSFYSTLPPKGYYS